jgi:hypothetical protein
MWKSRILRTSSEKRIRRSTKLISVCSDEAESHQQSHEKEMEGSNRAIHEFHGYEGKALSLKCLFKLDKVFMSKIFSNQPIR